MNVSIMSFSRRRLGRNFLTVALLSFLPVLSAQRVTGRTQPLSSPDQASEEPAMS